MLTHNHPELEGAEYVVFVDSTRRYCDCSEDIPPLLGWSRAEILKKSIDDVSFRAKEVPRLFNLYLRHGKMEGEYVLQHKSGAPVPVRYRAVTFPDGCKAAIWEPINDWREFYLLALMEVDPKKLRKLIDLALAAIHYQMHRPEKTSSAQEQILRDALSALQALDRTLD